jgi:hypothetical protein
MMVIGWLVASNVGLWAQAFKQYRWANYLHLYFMIMIAIVTWMSGFIAIIEFGLPLGLQYLHQNMGLAIMIMVFLQTVGGILSWSIQSATKTSPTVVSCSNLFHSIFGWALMILVMV